MLFTSTFSTARRTKELFRPNFDLIVSKLGRVDIYPVFTNLRDVEVC
jgi:hypothetical protein